MRLSLIMDRISFSSNLKTKTNYKNNNKVAIPLEKRWDNWQIRLRLILVWLFIALGTGGLGWRLYHLQIKQGLEIYDNLDTTLEEKAHQQQIINFSPYIPRRSIVDSNQNIVATDKVVYSFYAHPAVFPENFRNDRRLVAAKLKDILSDRTEAEIVAKLNQRDTGILLERQLNEEQAAKVKKLGIDGLELIQRYTRFYPQNELIADILGYVNVDHRGQAGIEYSQQNLLERYLAMLQVRRAGNGAIIPANLPEGIVELDDLQLQLTLDLRLQRATREALRQQVKKFKAKRGAVIVMDATDGAILSLACEPTYDPNRYYDYDLELFKNWTVTDAYEPGSTFKPLNVAIALDAGVINPNSRVSDPGHVQVDGWDIYNASKTGGGLIDITRVLQDSSNVGMINIMRRLKKEDYYQRLQELGLGAKMKVDLPFEASGSLKSKEIFTARSIEAAVTSFGQGFSLTPLKLVQLHGTLANGGKLVTPHVVRGTIDSQRNLEPLKVQPPKQVFSKNAADSVLKMMEAVVADGTGSPAKIEGYRIGGKTGTAQKAGAGGGYLQGAKITSFVSILPIDSPRYVILAVVDEPKGGNTFGSTVAAPVVKEVMESLIAIKGIPPSEPIPAPEEETE